MMESLIILLFSAFLESVNIKVYYISDQEPRMSYTHANRPMQLTTSLGEDVLLLTGFQGQESISAPFHFWLQVVSSDPRVSPGDLLRRPAAVSLALADGTLRYFHGLISRFIRGGQDRSGLVTYRVELVPWFWFLELTADCRIFQNMSVQRIVQTIFDENGYSDYEFRWLTAGQATRVYCVQYRESAFNFVSRLLEEEGIFYFFEHERGRHLMVMADTSLQHPPCPGPSTIAVSHTEQAMLDDDTILELSICDQVQTGKIALTDFNFEVPSTNLGVEVGEREEIYDYPGLYDNRSRGDGLSSVRLEEHLVAIQRFQGSSGCRAFMSGHYFQLKDFHRKDAETKQVLHAVSHQARQPMDLSTENSGDVFRYQNTFSSFPYATPFRPPRTARRPLVTGTQTAIVVGKAGEEIWCDSYGRVKVQFHWDRRGQMNEESSCWVRVSHGWAGSSWGAIYIPRIGQEVIVDFLEGDPDRPIITGRVYNAEQMPPYSLPEHQTRSTLKSNSSKGGAGSNELRFEDKKGTEEVFLHAQKDFNEVVENDHTTLVKHDQLNTVNHDRTHVVHHNESITIGVDQTCMVGVNRTEQVGQNETITIGMNRTEQVGQNETITIGMNRTEQVGINESVTVGASRTVSVGAGQSTHIGGVHTETVALAKAETIGLAKALSVGAAYQVSVGGAMNTTVGLIQAEEVGLSKIVKVGKKSSTTAGEEFTVVVGSASLTLKSDGTIILKGKDLLFQGSGDISCKASGNVVIKGTKTDVN